MNGKCLHCGKEHTWSRNSTGKYCSNQCQADAQYEAKVDHWMLFDIRPGLKVQRRYLLEINNHCWECGINEWNGKPITLELDHIDGNADNDDFNNLRMLCPNCHSQTPTFKNRNRGNGRLNRRLRANNDNARVA